MNLSFPEVTNWLDRHKWNNLKRASRLSRQSKQHTRLSHPIERQPDAVVGGSEFRSWDSRNLSRNFLSLAERKKSLFERTAQTQSVSQRVLACLVEQ